MSDIIINVENISKLYIIGKGKNTSLRDEIVHKWNTIFLKKHEEEQEFWALSNVSFKISKGEVIGIVGKNGAGKSTLLKILSRITPPTKGRFEMKGRVSSLLEVGTGFHPELTGRENIYLNGTILGMSRSEIRAKFDEIVSFSGVEKFIDTPVKRYSSGMYVRLAFSVAAHLEPEILIIDEVLAVGDAEFQKKCLGKMKDVSGHGRTVIFVSHNMSAVKSLCNKAIFLKNGQLIDFGDTAKVVNKYLNNEVNSQLSSQWNDINTAPGNEFVKLNKIEILSNNNENDFFVNHEIVIQFKFWYLLNSGLVNVSLHLYSASGDLVFAAASNGYELSTTIASFKAIIPPNLLNDGMYTISMMVVKDSKELYTFHECLTFEIKDLPRASGWYGKWPGLVRPTLKWEFDNITV